MVTTPQFIGHFTPVSNQVLIDKSLSTATRQILLIIEMRAGKSRLAKLTPSSLSDLSGYTRRTTLRAISTLIERGWLERTNENWLRLTQPQPESHFVQVFEGIVHHATWQAWQKHLLLFLLSQFRGSDREFGVAHYSLNLRGRKGTSIERNCRVPGKNPQDRRAKIRAFIETLEADGIIRIVCEPSSQRPAICTIARNALEKLPIKTNRTVRNDGQTEPRRSDKPNRAEMTNRTVRRDRPNRAEMTNRTDVEDSKESMKKPAKDSEPPVPPSAARGDSRPLEGVAIPDPVLPTDSVVAEVGESDGISVGELAPMMMDPRRRRLTKEVEDHCLGVYLRDSHEHRRRLAQRWAVVLDELPDDVQPDDVIHAITSQQFAGIRSRSWGLLLSSRFVSRFAIEIASQRRHRQEALGESRQSFDRVLLRLCDPAPAMRLDAVERLSSICYPDCNVLAILARLLIGEERDANPLVRITALRRLSILASSEAYRHRADAVREIVRVMLKDEDSDVREEAQCLLREMTAKS